MDEIKVIKITRAELKKHIDDYSASIVGGNAKEFSEYRYLCGVIYGLSLADRELVDLLSALEHDNE